MNNETSPIVLLDLAKGIWRYLSSSPQDLIALFWFIFCWIGYMLITDNLVRSSRSLKAKMHLNRVHWMTSALYRKNRVVDSNIIGNLQNSVSFLASTSILIIAGLLALLSQTEDVLVIIKGLPFAQKATRAAIHFKIMIMIALFVYAFFKYTWAIRQLNYTAILVGAMPVLQEREKLEQYAPAARRAAMVCTLAAKHMNRGLRSFYFAISTLAWFINPWFFMICSGWVVLILYRREFRSEIVHILNLPSELVEENHRPSTPPEEQKFLV